LGIGRIQAIRTENPVRFHRIWVNSPPLTEYPQKLFNNTRCLRRDLYLDRRPSRQGRPNIARQFIAGYPVLELSVPPGTDENRPVAHTFYSINVHYVFSTKNRLPFITAAMKERLWAFMGGIARENHMKALRIGGMPDHMHLLIAMPSTLSIAKGIQLIKGASSAWVHATFPVMSDFAWQEGYGAFSVSVSQLADTVAYIENQEEHHRVKSFQDEYRAFLQKHGIAYEEKYLWD
jgi:putative transposase